MRKELKTELETYCELYWWNMGRKLLDFKGSLEDLLKSHSITFTARMNKGSKYQYLFTFKNPYGITFKTTGLFSDFRHIAKQFIQMELVRMGDPSQLFVTGSWRPVVTVNR